MQNNESIMIVDQQKSNLEHLQNILSPLNYPIYKAYSGETALEKLKEDGGISLLLIEASLPSMDGYQLCSYIRDQEDYSRVSLIVLTHQTSPSDKVKGFDSGADDIITRPIHGFELQARVKNLLEAKSARRRMEDAYNSFHNIINHSEAMLEDFNPMWFSQEEVQRELFEQAFKGVDTQGAPESIYLYFPEKEDESEHLFVWHQGELIIKETYSENWKSIPECSSYTDYCYFNHSDRETGELVKACRECLPPEVVESRPRLDNHLAVVQEKVKAVAINFPQAINDIHANMFKGLVLQSLLYKTIAKQTRQIKDAFIYTARALARAAEAVDGETGNHIARMSSYSTLLGEELELNSKELEEISYSSMMHDVGKMKIGPEILMKEGPLTKEEFREMENHTVYGVMILGDSPYLEMARQIALSHHEKWDGSGYPYGLQGEEIPLVARIVALVDIYDALRSQRPYKPPFSHEKAYQIITQGDGRVEPTHFCPRVLEAFKKHHQEFDRIFENSLEGLVP